MSTKNDVIRVIKYPVRRARGLKSARFINKLANTPSSRPVKVGFIVQMPQLWQKTSSVYEKMLVMEEFETTMIIVPKFDISTYKCDTYGSELDFFISHALGGKYIRAVNDGKCIDLSTLGLDYVFYQRMYNDFIPPELSSTEVCHYTRVCYIPYSTTETSPSTIYEDACLRDLYLGFLEDDISAEKYSKKYKGRYHKRLVSEGYPEFEKCMKLDRSCSYKTILWTPRWSYDSRSGGSHFFEYNDFLTEYGNMPHKLIVRPHPLMWDNFIKEGRITPEEAENLKAKWQEKGIVTDSNVEIEDTFDQADIMISDRSSVIPMFFLTGKPVIYCAFDSGRYSDLYNIILPGIYRVYDQEQLEKTLDQLLSGEDPLREKRLEIIDKHFKTSENATERIVRCILDDCSRRGYTS
ncbi:MAG: CDP-glycerol glycerophosphotransferase family protein [Clostridiales bacterium]|nr:CDP-glycerol glycerophosphotransferase family protein [Clostridiales bacterium]